jgi:hypothetical protein
MLLIFWILPLFVLILILYLFNIFTNQKENYEFKRLVERVNELQNDVISETNKIFIQDILSDISFLCYMKSLNSNINFPLDLEKTTYTLKGGELQFAILSILVVDENTIIILTKCMDDNFKENTINYHNFKFKIIYNTRISSIELYSDKHESDEINDLKREFGSIINNKLKR